MKTEATITSKNQITIPSRVVKELKLHNTRVFSLEVKSGSILLTPKPNLKDTMSKYWSKHNAKSPVNDADLNNAIRIGIAKHSK
jgi:bifunctional DNA-binding transcriptional regulator/antitoxin component of YhaV-PrlF toxin-antitoxin module